MVKKAQTQQIGYWAFVLGVIVAILAGVAEGYSGVALESAGAVGAALVVLGVIVGWFNVKEKAFMHFMVASIVLVTAATVGKFALLDQLMVGPYITSILGYIALFVAPAAVLVALKVFWNEASGM